MLGKAVPDCLEIEKFIIMQKAGKSAQADRDHYLARFIMMQRTSDISHHIKVLPEQSTRQTGVLSAKRFTAFSGQVIHP